jgi:protein O-GlcNAc transferase
LLQVAAALPNRADVLLLMGAICYQLKDYAQCIGFNDRCILLDPNLAEAHANLANALQQMGNIDMAIVYYLSALRLKPYFTDAYNNMASALVQKGLIPEAMDCYMQVRGTGRGVGFLGLFDGVWWGVADFGSCLSS